MSVWKPISTKYEPYTHMNSWKIYRVSRNNEISDHVVGYCGEGRVSSKIQNFSKTNRIAITRSGRQYFLPENANYNNGDADYVWGHWLSINQIDKETIIDVTQEYQ